MSIYDEIQLRCNGGQLIRLLPALPKVGPARQIFISSEIMGILNGPWGNVKWETRCNELRADLERFTDGQDTLPVAEKPYKGKSSYLKRLDPPKREVWEIRSVDPSPAIRVFGCFAVKDVFVGLLWSERAPLRGPGDRAWRDATVECRTRWTNMFPGYSPMVGASFHDYISNIFLV